MKHHFVHLSHHSFPSVWSFIHSVMVCLLPEKKWNIDGMWWRIIIYINSLCPSVSRGFWGVGEGVTGEATDDRCQSVTGLDHRDFRV